MGFDAVGASLDRQLHLSLQLRLLVLVFIVCHLNILFLQCAKNSVKTIIYRNSVQQRLRFPNRALLPNGDEWPIRWAVSLQRHTEGIRTGTSPNVPRINAPPANTCHRISSCSRNKNTLLLPYGEFQRVVRW